MAGCSGNRPGPSAGSQMVARLKCWIITLPCEKKGRRNDVIGTEMNGVGGKIKCVHWQHTDTEVAGHAV